MKYIETMSRGCGLGVFLEMKRYLKKKRPLLLVGKDLFVSFEETPIGGDTMYCGYILLQTQQWRIPFYCGYLCLDRSHLPIYLSIYHLPYLRDKNRHTFWGLGSETPAPASPCRWSSLRERQELAQ